MPVGITTAEANRRFYRQIASTYDDSEVCVFGRRQQAQFRAALAAALAHANPTPIALDACGGSGNAASALAELGVAAVVVDVSREMVELWQGKSRGLGVATETHVQPIEQFLGTDPRRWDLITFCSALHHLEDYDTVLSMAGDRLRPGGIIFTMFDPTRATWLTARLRKLDWLLHLALSAPREFVRTAAGAFRRRTGAGNPDASVGRQAERHAYAGIDDLALVEGARARGLEVVVHDRYVDARLAVVARVFRALGQPSHFQLVLRKPQVGE